MNRALELGQEIADRLNAIEVGTIDLEQYVALEELRQGFHDHAEQLSAIRREVTDPELIENIDDTRAGIALAIDAINRHTLAHELDAIETGGNQ